MTLGVALQVLVTLTISFDFIASVFGLRSHPLSWQVREYLEIAAPAGLILGTVIGITAALRLARATRQTQDNLRIAAGQFQQMTEEKFDRWALTPSERDVGLFILKGLSNAEIAGMLNKSEGTIKAQSAAVFRKSGVTSRAQLMSLFLDILVAGPIVSVPEPAPAEPATAPETSSVPAPSRAGTPAAPPQAPAGGWK